MDSLQQLKLLLGLAGEAQDDLLSMLLDQQTRLALAYCNRAELPPALEGVVVQMAAAAYNRRGAEGESARSEGGVSRSFWPDDLPPSLRAALNRFRRGTVIPL